MLSLDLATRSLGNSSSPLGKILENGNFKARGKKERCHPRPKIHKFNPQAALYSAPRFSTFESPRSPERFSFIRKKSIQLPCFTKGNSDSHRLHRARRRSQDENRGRRRHPSRFSASHLSGTRAGRQATVVSLQPWYVKSQSLHPPSPLPLRALCMCRGRLRRSPGAAPQSSGGRGACVRGSGTRLGRGDGAPHAAAGNLPHAR